MLAFTTYYQAFTKIKALVEYDYRQIRYDKVGDRDGHYNQVRGGFKWDITGKTVGTAKFGWQGRDYDTESKPSFDGFVSEIGLATQFSAKTRLNIDYLCSAEESTYGSSNYIDRNLLRAHLTQGIWDRISVFGGISYRRDKYSEIDPAIGKKRVDDVVTPDVGILYSLQKWMDFKIAYEFAHDGSNNETLSYDRNLLSASVTGYF
jgi:polysaccharide biosynthesis protein VpsM